MHEPQAVARHPGYFRYPEALCTAQIALHPRLVGIH